MKNIFLINEVGDPYEMDSTVAVTTSIEEAKKLFPKKLWREVSRREGNSGAVWPDPARHDEYVFECVNSGDKVTIRDLLERPSPYVAEMPLNTIFVAQGS